MRRRDFVAGFGGAALAWPLAANAQQGKQRPVVAILLSPTSRGQLVHAFVDGLRDLGWTEGGTIAIERRSLEGVPERDAAMLAQQIASGVDVIMLGAVRQHHVAAMAATRTIPVVAVFTDDPVKSGLIDSLARPGRNLTGVTFVTGPEFQGKRLQLLRELSPGIARVAFLGASEVLEQFRNAERPSGITVLPVAVDAVDQYDEAFAAIRREQVDALMVSGGIHFANAGRIAAFAAESRLPAVYPWREAPVAGGLMSYGSNVPAAWRQAARLADKFLKGARLGEVPVEQPTAFELAINLKAATALGLSVPPALLARADEVIE